MVDRAPTTAAPSVTAAQVSRPTGSAMMFAFGSFGSCFATSGACAVVVITTTFCRGTSGSTRPTACWRNDSLPSNASNCWSIATTTRAPMSANAVPPS